MVNLSGNNCAINLWNEHRWNLDPTMLDQVMSKIAQYVPDATRIEIYPQERIPDDAPAWRFPGFLEWRVNIKFRSGMSLTLGAIQRGVDSPVEFHS